MKRKGMEGDFRSNIHQGGTGTKVTLSLEETQIALKAAHYLNLPITGVDLIRSKRGSLLLEINSAPGLEGIETYTKQNVAKAIITFSENHVYTKN